MSLQVPPQQVAFIKMLLALPEGQVDDLLQALAKARPHFNIFDLAQEVAAPSGLAVPLVVGILRVLASLYLTRNRQQTTEEFVDSEVYFALRNALQLPEEDATAQWGKLRKFFVASLSLERSLGTAAKAGPVLTEHERIFAGAKIMTDFRPIFHVDVYEKPDAAVIVTC